MQPIAPLSYHTHNDVPGRQTLMRYVCRYTPAPYTAVGPRVSVYLLCMHIHNVHAQATGVAMGMQTHIYIYIYIYI